MLKCVKNQLFFKCVLCILATFVKSQMDNENVKFENDLNIDVTSDLTDNELKLALSDLSLSDLQSLQELVDFEDYKDWNSQKNSFVNGKSNPLNSNGFERQELDFLNDFKAEQDNFNFNKQNIQNDLYYDLKPPIKFNQFLKENQRIKRTKQKSSIDKEYIKELMYSFPQTAQQDMEWT